MDCFKSTGKEAVVYRDLPAFDKVLIKDKLDVILIEGNSFGVRLEGGQNLLTLVRTEVESGELIITNENTCNVVRSYKRRIKLFVTAPRFREITHRGVGDVSCKDVLHSDSLIYRVLNSGNMYLNVDNTHLTGSINGMGDITCCGKTNMHILNASGESHINCGQLQTQKSDFYLKICGPSFISVSQELRVVIRHSGNVYYNGNPTSVQQEITGSGKLFNGF